ncbi:MAG TPA: PSD1 and planctomycete cytochrome C domain-containing protein [Tepidisphaeraceae bacterium]
MRAGSRLGPAVLALGIVVWICARVLAADGAKPLATALFTGDVRGILIQHCVKCHGGEKTKGEFDLTTREGLLHPGQEGVNVVAGNSGASRLMKLIRHEDDPEMPSKAPKLPDDAIAKIAAWIDGGAPYDKPLIEKGGVKRGHAEVTAADRQFWSFRPLPKEVAPPAVKESSWCRTDVDRFILARLEEKGIAPNGPADRRKLIRRAYLDLLGLPPKPEVVESFANDPDPRAWERVVDRLLASPQYGERWARHWLDLARFAESHGYEHDYDRLTAYHYRDFVIRALDEDMPYDRFVRLQVAGDEIEPNNPEALKATGYLAAGTHSTQITAATAEKERYDELDDMAGTVGTSLLALTVGCARCHDHKYDPIPTRDYYRLISTFTTTVRSELDIDTDPAGYQNQKREFDHKHQLLVDALAKFEKEQLPGRFDAWLASGAKAVVPKWVVLEMSAARSTGGATMARQADGSYLVSGKRPDWDDYVFTATTPLRGITAIKVEALADPSLPHGGPGRADNGNFALSDFSVTAKGANGQTAEVKLKNPRATFEQKGLPIAATIDPDGTSAWAVDPQFQRDHAATWELARPLDLGDGTGVTLTFTLKFHNNVHHGMGRPRIAVTTAPPPATFDGEQGSSVALDVNRILARPTDQRTSEDRTKLLVYYRSIDPEHHKLESAVREDLKHVPQPRKFKALVCSEGVTPLRLHTALPDIPDFYTKTYFLKRGDVSQKEGEAPSGFLTVLTREPDAANRWRVTPPPGSKLSYRRTALANWLTDVDQGAGALLARVIVNRLWQHHLGRGIVATPNDFGAQGTRPTHPELLDYLARQLIAGGWRLKPLHRLIMTSSVYMESTDSDEARASVDREDSLWWRRPISRLEGEAIRDSMLAVSGQLDPTMYGPGTLDESMRRRSIYFFVKRSKLIPMMMLFDWPDSLQGLGQRSSTTVAPQALALMNHPQVRSYAEAFARRILPAARNGSVEEAVTRAYLAALCRPPDAQELKDGAGFVREQAAEFAKAEKGDGLEMAMTQFCQTMFCLNEFIYVE